MCGLPLVVAKLRVWQRALDIVEEMGGSMEIVKCQVGLDKTTETHATLKVLLCCACAAMEMPFGLAGGCVSCVPACSCWSGSL